MPRIARLRPLALFAAAAIISGCFMHRQLAPPPPAAGPQATIEARLADPRLQGCHVGLAVYSLDRRQWLYERGADRLFVPASTVKLATAATALSLLGADYRPWTDVRFDGSRLGGVWRGTLTLVGGGDPLLGPADLDRLAGRLLGQGLLGFQGKVATDTRRFDAVRWGRGWMWDDVGSDDAPAVSALTVNLNRLALGIRPAGVGAALAVRREPATTYGTVRNASRCEPNGGPLHLQYRPVGGQDEIHLTGTLPPDSREVKAWINVAEPAAYAATLFAEAIGRTGRPVNVQIAPDEPAAGEVVASHAGLPLAEAVRRLNKDSVNLIGEMLLKQIGAVAKGLPGTAETGLAAQQALLVQAGWQAEAYRLVDGSGLSRYNLASPRQFAKLLAWVDDQDVADVYRASLPIGATDGTLAARFQGLAGADRIMAKTGTMSGVSALSGYLVTDDGERLAFSCLINGAAGAVAPLRALQDELVQDLMAWPR